jgi:hypothetical protein
MPFPKLYQNVNKQTTRRADTMRKIASENMTLGDDHAHKITSRIQNTRNTCFEIDLKTLIKKMGNRKKIKPHRLDKRKMLKIHRLAHLHCAH